VFISALVLLFGCQEGLLDCKSPTLSSQTGRNFVIIGQTRKNRKNCHQDKILPLVGGFMLVFLAYILNVCSHNDTLNTEFIT